MIRARLVDAGKLRPLIDERRFDLATAADGYRHLEGGAARGKVVVRIA